MRRGLGGATVVAALLAASRVQSDPAVATRVLVITTTEAEAAPWVTAYGLVTSIAVPGLSPAHPALRCNTSGVCLLVTATGKAAAAASVTALVESRTLDLSQTWFLVASLAAVDPAEGTTGSTTWPRYAVDTGVAWEIDARSLPAGWSSGYLGILTPSPSATPPTTFGTELYALDGALVDKARALSAPAALEDSAAAQAYRAHYAAAPANAPPAHLTCDAASSDTVAHGALLGQRAHDWVDRITGGQGTYCVLAGTDNAVLAALHHGAGAGLLDAKRVALLHAAARFDRPYPGQTALDAATADHGGARIAADNLLAAGKGLVDAITGGWATWQHGVAP